MNSNDIYALLKGVNCLIGVYARNKLPCKVNTRPSAVIVNTDPHGQPGEHWITIYLNTDGSVDYFDSFGLPPLHVDFYQFMAKNSTRGMRYNPITLQHITASTCGLYCVFYVQDRCSGMTHCDVVSKFSLNTRHNDRQVKDRLRSIRYARVLRRK